ncbi:AsnC family transcriptional regulator [Spirochaetia bacterium]|nr:AsnC family transcriptional regulator [Spirochaetia bacterium]
MDAIDRKILEILRKKARIPLKELSYQVNRSLPSTSERLHKLERAGYIKEYAAILDPKKFNKEFTCFCMVEFSRHDIDYDRDFVDFVMACPEILECHRITGTYEYMLKIVTRSVKDMEQLIEVMRLEKRVINTSTITILTSIKDEVSIEAE